MLKSKVVRTNTRIFIFNNILQTMNHIRSFLVPCQDTKYFCNIFFRIQFQYKNQQKNKFKYANKIIPPINITVIMLFPVAPNYFLLNDKTLKDLRYGSLALLHFTMQNPLQLCVNAGVFVWPVFLSPRSHKPLSL